MTKYPRNKAELLNNLRTIARDTKRRETRNFAVALAYIVNDICPEDRTTKHVFRRVAVEKAE